MSTSANHLQTTVLTLVFCWAVSAPAYEFAGGTGAPNDPYQIATAEQLIAIGADPNLLDKHFILVNDIDLDPNLPGGQVFTQAVIAPQYGAGLPWSVWEYVGMAFAGRFEGNGHLIRNLMISSETDYLGLFGSVGPGGQLRNLVLEETVVQGKLYVGGLTGWNGGLVTACHTSGRVSGRMYVGGLAGWNAGTISDCRATTTVTGNAHTWQLGGLVGCNEGRIAGCRTAGDVLGSSDDSRGLGGLVGVNLGGTVVGCCAVGQCSGVCSMGGLVGVNEPWDDGGVIRSSYAGGRLIGKDGSTELGGLVGTNYGAVISSCFANVEVSAGDGCERIGGLVGYNEYGRVANSYSVCPVLVPEGSAGVGALVGDGYLDAVKDCFWDVERCGIRTSHGGLAMATPRMKNPETYSLSGWASDPNWILDAGRDYPHLVWEGTPGKLIPAPFIDWFEGSGTPDDPYVVSSVDQMTRISTASVLWNRYFALACDLDFGGSALPRIGTYRGTDFTGVFDGRDHVLRNFTVEIDQTTASCIGLFGCIGPNGLVHDLGLEQIAIAVQHARFVGALAGIVREGEVINCYAVGRIDAGEGSDSVGGLVGHNEGGKIRCSYADSAVSGGDGSNSFGGLVGTNTGRIMDCYTLGVVSVGKTSNKVGGLVGRNGTVVLQQGNSTSIAGYVVNSYSTARVSASDVSTGVGGLVGKSDAGRTGDSFWDIESSGLGNSDGGAGLTTAQMKESQTYTTAGWDLAGEAVNGVTDRWMIPETGGYPLLTAHSDQYQPHALEGRGTSDDPYLVGSVEDLLAMCHYARSACYRLTNDIDMSGVTWDRAPVEEFHGKLDGSGFEVSNLAVHGMDSLTFFKIVGDHVFASTLNIRDPKATPKPAVYGTSYLGLFGTIGQYAVIENLVIRDANIVGSPHSADVGLLAGENRGTVTDCHVTGTITAETSPDSVRGSTALYGGLTGGNRGTLRNCHASVAVTGDYQVGGLVGSNSGRISRCSAAGSATARTTSRYLGGLAGSNGDDISECLAAVDVRCGREYEECGGFVGRNGGRIRACYATGDVTGGDGVSDLGGFVGNNAGNVARCYSTGLLSHGEGGRNFGGFVGWSLQMWTSQEAVRGSIEDCFWNVETSGMQTSDGGMGLATSRMMGSDVYSRFGWGGDPNWVLDVGNDYPRLAWEAMGGQPIALLVIDWFEGTGTQDDPYMVATPGQMALIGTTSMLWNKSFLLTTDLDMSGVRVAPIGLCSGTDFSGSFNGNGHVIRNLTIDTSAESVSPVGLFGYVARGGFIHDLHLENARIVTGPDSRCVGSLAGTIQGTVSRCHAVAEVQGYQSVGGLVGWNEGTISECTAAGRVTGFRELGGLVGFTACSTITRSSADCAVTGTDGSTLLGGLVGGDNMWSAISFCSATGDVLAGGGASNLGGLIGSGDGSVSFCFSMGSVSAGDQTANIGGLLGSSGAFGVRIINCYALGSVSGGAGGNCFGGLLGFSRDLTMIRCYAAGRVTSGIDNKRVGGLAGWVIGGGDTGLGTVGECYFLADSDGGGPDNGVGVPLTDAQMRQQASFVDWDFEGVWMICEGRDYPRLRWQNVQCEE